MPFLFLDLPFSLAAQPAQQQPIIPRGESGGGQKRERERENERKQNINFLLFQNELPSFAPPFFSLASAHPRPKPTGRPFRKPSQPPPGAPEPPCVSVWSVGSSKPGRRESFVRWARGAEREREREEERKLLSFSIVLFDSTIAEKKTGKKRKKSKQSPRCPPRRPPRRRLLPPPRRRRRLLPRAH